MTQSIDFRINDFINEYLDYKGYTDTVDTFSKERETRKEPINKINSGNIYDKEKERYQTIKEKLLKYLDNGNRGEFFQLWSEHIPSNIIDSDPSLKSLEFLLYTHFAIYYLRSNTPHKNVKLTQENMQVFKAYIESIRGQTISQTSDILPLFALPYVTEPEKNASFQELFADKWRIQLRTKLLNFCDWIFSSRPVPNLLELLQNGERASHLLTQIHNENEELKYRNRETNRQMKIVSTDYCNLIGITMELVETLQQAVVGKAITNEYIDNVCARLGLARVHETMFSLSDSSRLGIDDPFIEKLDYGKIKRDVVHPSTSSREKALLLQALRWRLTKAKTDFKREKTLECYIGCDLLGCRSDVEQRTKIIKQLSSTIGGDTYYAKEEWARLINTIASLKKGRHYLSPNESLIIAMQKAAISESSDTLIKQHLLAALQKLSLKRSVQSLMINQNIIKWLITILSKTDRLSDYTLEYGVALLMNLCLRTNGRKKCATIAEQAITVLSSLLTHPNHETRPYVNSSLYSILTLKSIRDKAMQLNLDNRLRVIIETERSNSETKGQLEFLLNLLYKGGDQDGRQTSDNEQDNEDEDQDIMEADLDLGDKLRASDKELSGDTLIDGQYTSLKGSSFQISYLNTVHSSLAMDPLLNRPVTPGQYRQSRVAHTVDSFANNLSMGDIHNSRSNHNNNYEYESKLLTNSSKKPSSVINTPIVPDGQEKQIDFNDDFNLNNDLDPSPTKRTTTPSMKFSFDEQHRSNSNASMHSSASSAIELNNENIDKQS
ncbi:unnamed protein product [Rotaria magnacalcarata]|uniref:LisH domain-containing protein ARMC9 n=4 Tax=Rotaria magnacalcarata TaxID=392030 RepID=A0A816WQC8_9BILA|nr:unnamed protein product [Rotaria magnacalcarata]CAF2137093.1 unnamed protein product [Rotaria magnacalcarata]CAF4134741.1 unnamed protein product [Rotaria magnacalcarata]CAF4205079.1 unnamed protein product [Rotaria magnacalcarata]